MRPRPLTGALGATAAALLMLPLLATHPASAAYLHVTAAPIQTWKIVDGLPELPHPTVDLSACGNLAAYDGVRYGTPGNDVLDAGNGAQVLVGLGGDDVLRGGNQDDCLLGGEGDDELSGGNGRDILVGGAGADKLDGGTGKDRLDAGGDDGDVCTSEGAPDELIGCGPVDLTAGHQPTQQGGQHGDTTPPRKTDGQPAGRPAEAPAQQQAPAAPAAPATPAGDAGDAGADVLSGDPAPATG